MEGSRHERAALVIISYFIGALTVFIWAASQQLNAPAVSMQSAAVVRAVLPTDTNSADESIADTTEHAVLAKPFVQYVDGVLEVNHQNGVRVLSFSGDIGDDADPSFADQGRHVGELPYVVSPADDFVFFCEVKSLSNDTCKPFIYDTLADTIYPVRKDGERVEIFIAAAKEATWTATGFTLGGVTAKTAVKPWQL